MTEIPDTLEAWAALTQDDLRDRHLFCAAAYDLLGYGPVGLSRYLNTGQKTVARWASGKTPVPGTAAEVVRLLIQIEWLKDRIARISPPPPPRRRKAE